ncbi:putative membrane protein [Clostridium bornimense]|uniref:Putative membrane protein n=1 Tax=Clostridium bornimense TaxID=1216932 RepID=W6S101_9CLOT|nr:CdaR family protein [Clostridium bornimense]CDM69544.1 putative membrane protein [Clostridium bornimense]
MDRDKRKEGLIKLGCILVSFFLWIMVSSSNDPIKTTAVKNVKVKVVEGDALKNASLVMLSNNEFYVDVTIRGASTDVYSVKASDFSLQVDLNKNSLKAGNNRLPIEIKKKPENVAIQKQDNLYIDLNLDSIITKKFSVVLNIEGTGNKEGKILNEPYFDVSEVTVKGPSTIVNTINKVEAVGKYKDITEGGKNTLNIIALDKNNNEVKGIDMDPKQGNVTLTYSKIKSVPIKINTLNNPQDNIRIDNISTNVNEVSISGDEDVLNSIYSINTENIDLSNIKKDTTVQAKLNIPNGVFLVSNNNKISVDVDVTVMIEKEVKATVTAINTSEEFEYQYEPKEVTVKLYGEESKISSINTLIANVDFQNANEDTTELEMVIEPIDGVEITYVDTNKCKVTIKKKESGGQ